jgi:predicted Kef-type K+ transport protein
VRQGGRELFKLSVLLLALHVGDNSVRVPEPAVRRAESGNVSSGMT